LPLMPKKASICCAWGRGMCTEWQQVPNTFIPPKRGSIGISARRANSLVRLAVSLPYQVVQAILSAHGNGPGVLLAGPVGGPEDPLGRRAGMGPGCLQRVRDGFIGVAEVSRWGRGPARRGVQAIAERHQLWLDCGPAVESLLRQHLAGAPVRLGMAVSL